MSDRFKVFYIWQSDLPNRGNRTLIQDALEKVGGLLTEEQGVDVEIEVDRDTLAIPGAPDIAQAILQKIDAADAVVADVTPINSASESGRPTPNPNVLFELGYAVKSLGPERVVLAINEEFGDPESLPFDLRGRRIMRYRCGPSDSRAEARRSLAAQLAAAVSTIMGAEQDDEALAGRSEFASSLFRSASEVRLLADESHERRIDPWFSEISEVYGAQAGWLRESALLAEAKELGMAALMEELASALDAVASHVHTLGGSASFKSKIACAAELAEQAQNELLGGSRIDDTSRAAVSELVDAGSRKLKAWLQRVGDEDPLLLPFFQEMLASVTELGEDLAMVSYYGPGWLGTDASQKFREIGISLHLAELAKERVPARQGSQEVLSRMREAAAALDELLENKD